MDITKGLRFSTATSKVRTITLFDAYMGRWNSGTKDTGAAIFKSALELADMADRQGNCISERDLDLLEDASKHWGANLLKYGVAKSLPEYQLRNDIATGKVGNSGTESR